MDLEHIWKQRKELNELFNSIPLHSVGLKTLSDQQVGSLIRCVAFDNVMRVNSDKKDLLAEIAKLKKENKELKQKLAMQFLQYNGKAGL